MKKNLFMAIMLVCFLVLPAIARASFFDDSGGKWWMNQDQWGMFYALDPEGRTNLQDVNNRLELTAANGGWTDGYAADRDYISKWGFDTSHDFEFQTNFHYSHVGQVRSDRGTIGMGVMGFANSMQDPMQDPNWQQGLTTEDLANLNRHLQAAWISAKNSVTPTGFNYYGFYAERSILSTESDTSLGRTYPEGLFWAKYNAEQDSLSVKAYEKFGPGDTDLYNPVSSTYTGLRDFYNIDKLRVSLGGTSDGAGLAGGEAYLYNFQVNSGTMTPEPVSSILFLLGAGALGSRSLLRKRRKA